MERDAISKTKSGGLPCSGITYPLCMSWGTGLASKATSRSGNREVGGEFCFSASLMLNLSVMGWWDGWRWIGLVRVLILEVLGGAFRGLQIHVNALRAVGGADVAEPALLGAGYSRGWFAAGGPADQGAHVVDEALIYAASGDAPDVGWVDDLAGDAGVFELGPRLGHGVHVDHDLSPVGRLLAAGLDVDDEDVRAADDDENSQSGWPAKVAVLPCRRNLFWCSTRTVCPRSAHSWRCLLRRAVWSMSHLVWSKSEGGRSQF